MLRNNCFPTGQIIFTGCRRHLETNHNGILDIGLGWSLPARARAHSHNTDRDAGDRLTLLTTSVQM